MEARKVTPWKHSESSVNKWGGKPEDYIEIHDWFDETKQYTGDWTHRVLRHHAAGIQWAIEKFGHSIENSDGKEIPVKMIAERHVEEDCGFVPTVADYLKPTLENPENWMLRVKTTSVHVMQFTE